MKYNFDNITDRSKNNAAKFEEAYIHFGTNDVIPLWIADMDFKTAQPIIDAIKSRAEQGIFGYTNRPDEYYEAVRLWQKRRNNWEADTNLMSFAPGVVPAMKMLIEEFTQKGDKIIIQTPVYHPFTDVVLNSERNLVINSLKEENGKYVIDYEDFENKIKCDVKYFLLCNPHNPVGRSWTYEELKKLGDLCLKYNVKIISDEIHSDLMLFGHKHTVMASVSAEINEITITCNAPSKTFNLAGLQSALIIFPNAYMKKIYDKRLSILDIARNNCFSLVSTIAAYNEGEEWLSQLITYLEGNMLFINDYCRKYIPRLVPNIPECTYLCWINAKALNMTDEELKEFTVIKAKVALNIGNTFGEAGTGYLRLNAACPRSILEKALNNISSAIDNI